MQGCGLGRRLVAHRLEVIRPHNQEFPGAYPLVQVRTSPLVASFYARQGFELVKSTKDFWVQRSEDTWTGNFSNIILLEKDQEGVLYGLRDIRLKEY